MAKIVPHLWYAKEAEEAAKFYASTFPGSKVDRVSTVGAETPSGPAGSVKVIELTLMGQAFMLLQAGPHADFNDAVSFLIPCEDQAEIDRYWNAILETGGQAQACGWIKDRWGVRWQINYAKMGTLMSGPGGKRVAEAMMKMIKIDVAALHAAAQT
jgi:predicted 3-demethylubiquinone-9 3-methyltransferase (glyoxalase superfamily)